MRQGDVNILVEITLFIVILVELDYLLLILSERIFDIYLLVEVRVEVLNEVVEVLYVGE